MTQAFPALVYRSPGENKKPGGGTYKYIGVQSQDELDAKLAEGWHLTSADAITAAGDKANGLTKPKPKWALKPTKKKKPANPLGLRKQAPQAPIEAVSDTNDTAPPTRAELEAKATELGIRFDGRTKDKKLGQLIADRLSETTAGD
jgi:hypothetical protein